MYFTTGVTELNNTTTPRRQANGRSAVLDFAVAESAPFTGLKSRHVQSVELVNEAGQFGLVIRRDSKDLGTQKGISNVSDPNRTYEKSGFGEDEFQMQLVSHPKTAVAFELEPLFREVNDFAGICLIPAVDLTAPIDQDAKESSLLSHNLLHLIGCVSYTAVKV
jgi:hypothetical protein